MKDVEKVHYILDQMIVVLNKITIIVVVVSTIFVIGASAYGIHAILNPTGIAFVKSDLDKTEIMSNEVAKITVNVKNFNELFDNLTVKVKTDDVNGDYLRIDRPSFKIPPLNYPNDNTGDQTITITPYNIPLETMPFKITIEVYSNGEGKPMITQERNLTVKKLT